MSALTVDDLFVSVPVVGVNGVVSGAGGSAPLLIAPYPMSVESLRFVAWSSEVPASDSAYWTVKVLVTSGDGLTGRTMSVKTTRVTGGEPMSMRRPWLILPPFTGGTLAAGESLSLRILSTGSPAPIVNALMTVGYRPL